MLPIQSINRLAWTSNIYENLYGLLNKIGMNQFAIARSPQKIGFEFNILLVSLYRGQSLD